MNTKTRGTIRFNIVTCNHPNCNFKFRLPEGSLANPPLCKWHSRLGRLRKQPELTALLEHVQILTDSIQVLEARVSTQEQEIARLENEVDLLKD